MRLTLAAIRLHLVIERSSPGLLVTIKSGSEGSNVRTSAVARIAMMAVLMVALLIPLMMILGVVSERAGRREEAAQQISEQWGGAQTLAGPLLSVEFHTIETNNSGKTQVITHRAFFLPAALQIEAEAVPEIRRRGLFEVIVYRSRLKLTGRFAPPDFSPWRVEPGNVLGATASLSVGVTDPRGIAGPIFLKWNGVDGTFVPGMPDTGAGLSGISANVALPEAPREMPFEILLEINGTRDLRFTPVGNDTTVNLVSPWPHPSFSGAPLPKERTVSAAGFTASWMVPYYGRQFPHSWTLGTINREQHQKAFNQSSFGVGLIRPVDIYQQSERAVKYAALFVVMTFVIAFLWEVVHGVLVHPIQYLFIGFAMCVFYLLLLALSEHVGFDRSYVIAAVASGGLISWYWNAVIRGGSRHGVLMGGVLAALYGYLYLLLRLEDYALAAGSVGLFLMLAVVMFLTRRIDWYTLKLGRDATSDVG
ncbi:MAG: cell envelope integrity protein CreD [Vicinamibacterales bacterium]